MKLEDLKTLFASSGCKEILVKQLAPNDNSKNQVYFGGSFEILNVLPVSDIKTESAGDWKRERFKASLGFSWLLDDGRLSPAPHAQLILYPKYPEVRFSGFLLGSENAPAVLMRKRLSGRLLFIGVTNSRKVIGYVAHPESEIAKSFLNEKNLDENGVFSILDIAKGFNSRSILLRELARIHNNGWITSKRLNSAGNILPCKSSNCGGYTLEAELNITPNGFSEPDFLGWEIKQFSVRNFSNINSSTITLMTPEPTNGIYKSEGVEYFIRTYGYPDKLGRADRMNFGGIHRAGVVHSTTHLELKLIGYDEESGKIRNSNGYIALIDKEEKVAASWSFSSMLMHWNRKHDKACYVPSMTKKEGSRMYRYGGKIILGTRTDFQLFLKQMSQGNIFYDPGIKMENVSSRPVIKRRSQFRIKSKYLSNLYKSNEILDLVE